jgi:hypothetical protein
MYSDKLDITNYFVVDSTENKSREDLATNELKCRGMVFKNDPLTNTNTLVASTFPYTEEFSISSIDIIDKTISEGEWSYYKSYEGTIIRIIHDEQDGKTRRIISTHKKLDAYESFWGSENSYGSLFENEIMRMNPSLEFFENFLDSLDKKYHYTFLLLSNNQNKIVSSHNNKILFVGCFDRETNEYVEDVNIESVQFSRPDRINLTCAGDILEHVKNVDPYESQGIIAFRKDKFELFKVINDKYKELSMLRGNNSNLNYRYIQLRKIDNVEMLNNFTNLFSATHNFTEVENNIRELCVYIHHTYYNRHILKNFVFVNPVFHSILKKIHNWHLQDKKKNICTFNAVYKHISECDANTIFYMIKEWKKMETTGENLI